MPDEYLVVTMNECENCQALKAKLDEMGLEYTEVNAQELQGGDMPMPAAADAHNDQYIAAMAALMGSGLRVPVIMFNGKVVDVEAFMSSSCDAGGCKV